MANRQSAYGQKYRSSLPILLLLIILTACKMNNSSTNTLPRLQELPLFDPHVAAYTCAPVHLPPFDAEADAWFQEARALEDPGIYVDDRNYKNIVALTRQAAQRHHWKAMLNLASLIVEGRDAPSDTEDAVQLVEAAMRLGVPAAFDRMGTYYMNGTGVKGDATRAYAFWQHAAQMGSPEALTDLGRKMISVDDHPERQRWANEKVGTTMLECAYGQGYGPAAYHLGFQYSMPTERSPTREDLDRALLAWNNGIKFGSAECAAAVSSEFSSISNRSTRMVLHTDMARSDRYDILTESLEFHPDYRFPNLDKILPLPPADLPPWNGDRNTLINAARGVSYTPSTPSSLSALPERKGRNYPNSEYRLVPTDDITEEAIAPFTGYWQPIFEENQPQKDSAGKIIDPGLYQGGELFERVQSNYSKQIEESATAPRWQNWRTVRHDQGNISPSVVSGRTRSINPPAKAKTCAPSERCPVAGTWQPWLLVRVNYLGRSASIILAGEASCC